ncbi:hypothetical protein BKA82DRAFT_9388 [Pisolithus tinctorius]|nr:hypothetical protein BKA82DRAFT_9388 [Pisolithus tinctorius]
MSTQTQQPAPLARTSSFFGAIRNIVTAPLQWLTGSEDFEDTRGKRRRLPVPSEQSRAEDDSLQSKKKRMRVTSPPRGTQAYLDPPPAAFRQPRRASEHFSSSSHRHLSASPRKSLRAPAGNASLRPRRTVSPLPSRSHLTPAGVTRTMSLDPPSNSSFSYRTQSVSSMQDIVEEHGVAKDSMSISRDSSMSPGRQLRPSGSDFGPVVPSPRERDPSQPPPLATLMSHPTFVKPPSNLQKPDAAETAKQLTLGSLVDAQRSARPVSRNSSILFGTSSATDVSARPLWPTNAAEKALHELEVYKTPLLPTRLRASGTIPDMFLPKKGHHITLMTDDREDKPRLGMKGKVKERGKKKDKETPNGSKPYAGEGGMKKWLARRRMEEEQAKEKEKTEAMLDEEAEEDQRRNADGEKEKQRASELQVPPPPLPTSTVQPRAVFGREASSLRVGRTKTGRNHIERPMSRRMKKFSAAFEDEDEEMDDSSVAPSFSFGRSTETAKKEDKAPLPGPFSFGSTPTQPTTETKAAPALALGTIATASAPSAPSFTFGPSGGSNAADVSSKSFSFTPTTPVRPATPPKVEQEVNMDESPTREMNINGSGKVPERPTLNFSFPTPSTTGSALFAQSPATPAPTFSFGTSTVNPFAKDAKAADEKPKTSFGFGQTISTGFSQKAPESPAVSSPAPFAFSQPSPSVAPTSPFGFGAPSSNPFSQASAAAPASPSVFNRPASTPAFTFGGSPATQPSSSPFVFGSGSQPASPANNNVNLPTSSAGSSFMFNPPSGATPAPNPFNTPSSAAPPAAGGGSLFTIGSAPPPESGGRQIKKLPRRGGARR